MASDRQRAHVIVPADLLREVDALVGPRRRSESGCDGRHITSSVRCTKSKRPAGKRRKRLPSGFINSERRATRETE
jgi:hypothetical protein